MVRPGMNYSCFTSFLPNCQMNNNIKNRNKIDSDSQYRKFLQTNASTLMSEMNKVCFSKTDKVCNLNCQNK